MSDLHVIPDAPQPRTRRGLRLTTLMLGVLVVGGMIGMIGRAILQAREGARASQCGNNLKQIGLDLYNYHCVYGVFPPAFIADASGKPIHSWRTLIIPFMESNPIWSNYSYGEPWDGPNNKRFLDQVWPPLYRCPSHDAPPGSTSYVMIVGPGTVNPGVQSITLSEIADGPDQTIMIAEVANLDIPWTEPRDLDTRTISWLINEPSHPSISSHHKRPGVVFANGAVQGLDPTLSPSALKALTTIHGGEPEKPH